MSSFPVSSFGASTLSSFVRDGRSYAEVLKSVKSFPVGKTSHPHSFPSVHPPFHSALSHPFRSAPPRSFLLPVLPIFPSARPPFRSAPPCSFPSACPSRSAPPRSFLLPVLPIFPSACPPFPSAPPRVFRSAPPRVFRSAPPRVFRSAPPPRVFRSAPPPRVFRSAPPPRVFRSAPPPFCSASPRPFHSAPPHSFSFPKTNSATSSFCSNSTNSSLSSNNSSLSGTNYPLISRSMRPVFSGVERGKLGISEKAAISDFISKLKVQGSIAEGKKGCRKEWLFADRSYSYGYKLRHHVEPCGAFSEVEHLCAGVVRDLGLVKPNACLLVYYPEGTSGLKIHKDTEPAHACDQVITLCHGVGAALVIADNKEQEVAREWLEGGDFYVFRDQSLFKHGVDGIKSTGGGRWAFTFRVFTPPESARSIRKPRPRVSNSGATL